VVLLAVEFLDELVSGAWTAAWPLIRTDLGLSYAEIGVLLSLPSIFGSALEPPFAFLGDSSHRRTLVRGGGIAFLLAIVLIASSGGFVSLLLALMLFNPASGVFVGLSQAALMDADPARHEPNMARWVLAGSLGALSGPLVLAAVGWGGLGWRSAFTVFAVGMVPLLVLAWRMPMAHARADHEIPAGRALLDGARDAIAAIRERAVLRWLGLLQFADLVLDVLMGFLALYFVDVAGASQASAAMAIVVWTGVGLLGDALVIPLLERVEGTRYLRASAAAMLLVLPAFLLVDGPVAKLIVLGVIALLNSGWYSVLQGRLYSELPGRSGTVMALASTFGILGGVLPLFIGVFADRFGLGAAMWLLLVGPIALLIGLPRQRVG
jgi:FSR family fosmidomycin resistance protein-like MFS transporter